MAEDHVARYLESRIEGATDLAAIYNLYKQAPECFLAGVQYALDKVLSLGERAYNVPSSELGEDVVTVKILHLIAIDILSKAKERQF